MNIAIVNYEAGNIGSVKYALEQCGYQSFVAYDYKDLDIATHIILPGVGAFNDAMYVLKEKGFDQAIKHCVLEKKIPFLGICLGMQLLATKGNEGGETMGLDLIPGHIEMLRKSEQFRLPHVGWNEISLQKQNPLLEGINFDADFYFLHSYHLVPDDSENVIANTYYGKEFASIVNQGNVFGVQFHPEKSGKLGRQILKNFATLQICLN